MEENSAPSSPPDLRPPDEDLAAGRSPTPPAGGKGDPVSPEAPAPGKGMRGRSWASGLFLGALVLLVGAGAGGWYAWQQWRNAGTPRPPEVAPEDLDSDVAALVKAARERVLREPRSAAAWGALAE